MRGRLLAEHLSPMVGTVLETHPRASLLFALGEGILEVLRDRGDGEAGRAHLRTLWRRWSGRFGITPHEPPVLHDGALDSLVCATVAYLFHREPTVLHRLRHETQGKVGRGPFYVVAPGATPEPDGAGSGGEELRL